MFISPMLGGRPYFPLDLTTKIWVDAISLDSVDSTIKNTLHLSIALRLRNVSGTFPSCEDASRTLRTTIPLVSGYPQCHSSSHNHRNRDPDYSRIYGVLQHTYSSVGVNSTG